VRVERTDSRRSHHCSELTALFTEPHRCKQHGAMSVDLAALRSYIVAKDDQMYDGLAEDMVSLSVTHSNLKQKWPELRFVGDMPSHLRPRYPPHPSTVCLCFGVPARCDG